MSDININTVETSVTIYTKSSCHYCDVAKKEMTDAGMKFTEIKIGEDMDREMVKTMFPDSKTAPIVVLTQTMIGDSTLAVAAAKEFEYLTNQPKDEVDAQTPN